MAARTITFDEESPEMTPDMIKQFKRMKQKGRTKLTVSIRLSEKAQKFSKAYGKGYTSFLSRLIDAALEDASLVKSAFEKVVFLQLFELIKTIVIRTLYTAN